MEPELEKYSHQRGELYLTISYVSEGRRLVAMTQRTMPLGVLIGLQLEDSMVEKEKKNMRDRLIRRLGLWCHDGGVSSTLPDIPAEFYKYTKNAEGKLFEFIIDRLATTYGITDPRKKDSSRRVLPLQSRGQSSAADALVGEAVTLSGSVDVLVVRILMDELLRISVLHESKRVAASASKEGKRKAEDANSRGIIVLKVNAPWLHQEGVDYEGMKGEVEAIALKAFGAFAVRLRATIKHQPAHVTNFLPIVLSCCKSIEDVQSVLYERLAMIAEQLLPQQKSHGDSTSFQDLPSPVYMSILSFLGSDLERLTVDRACTRAVMEEMRRLAIRGGGESRAGAGASLLARCPGLKTLILKERYALEDAGRFVRGGWHFPRLRSLQVDGWGQITETNLKDVVEEFSRRQMSQLVELKIALTDRVYPSATMASSHLIRLVHGLPNLKLLEVTAPGRVGLTMPDVNNLASATAMGQLVVLELDLDCRGGAKGMPLDLLLAKCPSLQSLKLSWKFVLFGIAMGADPTRKDNASALCREGVGMVAAALPQLPKLRSLQLCGDMGLHAISTGPLFTAMAAAQKPLLHTLGLSRFVWDHDSWHQLLRSGRLGEIEQLRLISCGLCWKDLLTLLREAVSLNDQSLLAKLNHLDGSSNPLFTPEEVAGHVIPATPIMLPPLLRSIRIKCGQELPEALMDSIKKVFASARVLKD